MFACLFGDSPRLAELAGQFSPSIQKIDAQTVAFSIAGLGALFGDAHQVAAEIARRGADMGVTANLAIAANLSAAILAARNLPGTTILSRGKESQTLAGIPVEALPAAPETILTLRRWGIRTLGELGALPETGLVERLGEAGSQLRAMALGQGTNLLDAARPATEYTARQDLDHPMDRLEPLLFLLSAHLRELTDRLQKNGCATNRVTVALDLAEGGRFTRSIELPVATCDPGSLLKHVQLALEAQPPPAAPAALRITLDPAEPRIAPGGLFLAAAPEPGKLQTLLARLRALVGEDRVGSPEILNTHRPDAHRLRPCAFEPGEPGDAAKASSRLAFRYFRPAVAARVTVRGGVLQRVVSARVSGAVLEAAGPWRTSGEWWADTKWNRDEWDVVLEDWAIYRLYLAANQWFLDGSYD